MTVSGRKRIDNQNWTDIQNEGRVGVISCQQIENSRPLVSTGPYQLASIHTRKTPKSIQDEKNV